MPRGEKGRKFSKDYQPSPKSREKAKKTAKENAEKRKTFREVFESLLNGEYTNKNGKTVSGSEALAMKVFEKALVDGDLEAFRIIRDMVGEKPIEKIATMDITQESISDVQDYLNGIIDEHKSD